MSGIVFTTFEVAELLGVAISSVIAWINEGKLTAHRTPGGHRRIQKESLMDFLRIYHMPIPEALEAGSASPLPAVPKIVIVDDDPIAIRQLSLYTKASVRKVELFVARDGFEAGQLILSEQPDLVILDIFLPGLDGFEVCKRIRSNPLTRHARILAVTARPKKDILKKIMESGADVAMAKPIAKELFVETVRELVGSKKTGENISFLKSA